MSTVLTERDPAAVRDRMAEVAAQAKRDDDLAELLQGIQTSGLKAFYSVADPYGRNDSN